MVARKKTKVLFPVSAILRSACTVVVEPVDELYTVSAVRSQFSVSPSCNRLTFKFNEVLSVMQDSFLIRQLASDRFTDLKSQSRIQWRMGGPSHRLQLKGEKKLPLGTIIGSETIVSTPLSVVSVVVKFSQWSMKS